MIGAVKRLAFAALAVLLLSACQGSSTVAAARPATPKPSTDPALSAQIRSDSNLNEVLAIARRTVLGGLNAGDSYPGQVWIRDLNTFLRLYLTSGGDREAARQALLRFLQFQGASGHVPDFWAPHGAPGEGLPGVWRSPLAPGYWAISTTVEADQESSLVQAFASYTAVTGDVEVLQVAVGGQSVLARLEAALHYLLRERQDAAHGLLWSAATIDWGDAQAGDVNPNFWGPGSKKTLGIYANAMLSLALQQFLSLPGVSGDFWRLQLQRLNHNITVWLWDGQAQKYRAHVYLEGSPFPTSFNEAQVTVHGGTAVAILAGLLTPAQVRTALLQQEADAAMAGAQSIGITTWPAYPAEAFKSPPPEHFIHGDWDWFGARMIQGLIAYHLLGEAYQALKPMLERVRRVDGFREWWTYGGEPRGSTNYRGPAGQIGLAIEELQQAAQRG